MREKGLYPCLLSFIDILPDSTACALECEHCGWLVSEHPAWQRYHRLGEVARETFRRLAYGPDPFAEAVEIYKNSEEHARIQGAIDKAKAVETLSDRAEDGRKNDADKIRLDLLPPKAIELVGAVLTFGARKYAPDNWRKVQQAKARYSAAALRHLFAWLRGEENDPESGLPHLAHAATCLLFLMESDL